MAWFDEPDLVSGDQTSARALGSSYTITSIIGRGSTGEVWRGFVTATGEPIAAKLLGESLTHETAVVARFIRERALLTRVVHRNVVSVRDLVVEGNTLAIVTDLVDGPSLRDALDRNGTFRASDAVEMCRQILLGLGAVHQRGLIHRDLKPENILLERGIDGRGVARLVDFGIAQLAHGDSDADSGDVVGSAEYIAPELLEGGTASPASDLYALGIVLYELVSGRTPFGSELAVTVIRRQVSEPPGRPAGMPPELWTVLERLLAKNPNARPESAEAAEALLSGAQSAVASLPALPVAQEHDPVVFDDGNETIITAHRPHEPKPRTVATTRSARVRPSFRIVALAIVGLAALAIGALAAFPSDPAPTVTLQSVTEYLSGRGSQTVRRTIAVDGRDVRVQLVVSNVPFDGLTLVEYVPTTFRAPGTTIRGTGLGTPDAHGRLTIAVPNEPTKSLISYYFRARGIGDSQSFLDRYEQARVAALLEDTAARSTNTVVAIAVTPEIRLRANERAWLHVTGVTAREGELVSETTEKLLGWSNSLRWQSSHPSVAFADTATSDNGGASGRRYPVVHGVAPGRTRLTTRVAGHTLGFDVEVLPSHGDSPSPCEAGTSPQSQLAITELGDGVQIAEGTVIPHSGTWSIVRSGKPTPIDRASLCSRFSASAETTANTWLELVAAVNALDPRPSG